MNPDRSLNLEPIGTLAEVFVRAKLGGVFVCGTTGEGVSLTVSERQKVAERWREVVPEDFPVLVNVSALCLEHCRALASHAQGIGAYAVASTAPCFFKPVSPEDLALFCAEIANSAPDLPFYYYHIPEMTGVNIPVYDFFAAAAPRISTLAGAKFTTEDLTDYSRCLTQDGGRFDMLFGREQMLLSALVLGAKGAVGTTYNFAAPLFQRIMDVYEAGDIPTARTEQTRAAEMISILGRFGGLAAGKAVMKIVGLDCGPPRLPQRPLSQRQSEELREELGRIGLFERCFRF
jgi:N-acetylneuraminate lyase